MPTKPQQKRTIKQRVATWLLEGALPVKREVASAGALQEDDEKKYRRISASFRDFNPYEHERSIKLSIKMFRENPFFKRLVRVPVEAIMSSGINIIAEDDKVQALINTFWGDKQNGLSKYIRNMFIDMLTTGELHLPILVNPINGAVSLTVLDTVNIKNVFQDPVNPLRRLAVEYHVSLPETGKTTKKLVIVNKGGIGFSYSYDGEILSFFYDTNGSCGNRGYPAAFALIDWADLFDQALFGDTERWAALRTFIWDVTLDGKTEEECDNWLAENFPEGAGPKPNSVLAHNEKLRMSAVTPDLKAGDSKQMFDLLRTMIVGSAGYPTWFFGYGDTNVATAREQNAPAVWHIEDVQTIFQNIIETIIDFQVYQAKQHRYITTKGVLTPGVNGEFKVQMGTVLQRDIQRFVAVLGQAVSSVAIGIKERLLDVDTGFEVICYVLNQHDFKLTPKDLKSRLAGIAATLPTNGKVNTEIISDVFTDVINPKSFDFMKDGVSFTS